MEVISETLLSHAQKSVALHNKGPLRVCAGPGTGKTTAMVARAKKLVAEGIDPDRILIVTYSRRTADEIRKLFDHDNMPVVKTLHSIGYQIIHRNQSLIGEKKLATHVDHMFMLMDLLRVLPKPQQIDDTDKTRLIKSMNQLLKTFECIEQLGEHEYMRRYPKAEIEKLFLFRNMFRQKINAGGYITYDEQIKYAVQILENYPDIRKAVIREYDYIQVDEAQDLDPQQSRFIRLMVREPDFNIAVFGDVDQAIYGFRGGSEQFLMDFAKYYPDAVDIFLDENFRSTQEILGAANILISHNINRLPILVKSNIKSCTMRPVWLRSFNVGRIGDLIQDIVRKKNCNLDQIAVIARTNAELEQIGGILDYYNKGVPSVDQVGFMLPKYYLYQDWGFQILLDVLSIAVGQYQDNNIWIRLLNTVGYQDIKCCNGQTIYEEYLERGTIYAFDSDEAELYYTLPESECGIIRGFAKIYRICQMFFLPLETAVNKAFIALFGDRFTVYMDSLAILQDIIRERRIKRAKDLWKYMSGMQLFADNTRIYYPSFKNRINMLTAHDAKGRQFMAVIIYGVDQFETGNIQEDRRLLYVAMTRAESLLIMAEAYQGRSTLLNEFGQSIDVIGGRVYA